MFCFLAFFSSTVAMIRLRSGWQMTNFSECNKIETKERCPWVDLNLTAYYQIYWSVSEEVLLTLKRKTILNTRKNCCLLLLLHHYISSFQKDGKRKWSFSPNNLRYLQMTGPEREGKAPKKTEDSLMVLFSGFSTFMFFSSCLVLGKVMGSWRKNN